MTSHPTWIATRILTLSAFSQASPPPGGQIEVMLGVPEPVAEHQWRCPYRVTLPSHDEIQHGYGEDALQALLGAIMAVRKLLDEVAPQATWYGTGTTGIPRMIPQVFGAEFAARLEHMVDQEVERFAKAIQQQGNAAHPPRSIP